MKQAEIRIQKLHKGQQEIANNAARYNVIDCGRRFGKTMLGINRAVKEGLRYPVGWFAPTHKMMTEVWREMNVTLAPIIERRSTQERRLELITGGVIEFWSLDNPDSGRGRRYKRIIVDEAALVADLMGVWQNTLRSTLIDYEGDAYFLSTPKGHNGFWQMWQWGNDEVDGWRSWKMPTYVNPVIPPSEIEEIRRTMPERTFNQEIMAEFLDDGGGVFRNVREAATLTPERQGNRDAVYVYGLDWAKMNDFTVIVVMDSVTKSMVYMDRFNQVDYSVQVGRLKALCERFKPTEIIAESNSVGEPIIEQIRRENLPVKPFTTTNASKSKAIDALSLAFEQRTIKILDDPILTGELLAYDMTRLPSGLMRYGAPEGTHDDCVMALALAWEGCVNRLPSNLSLLSTPKKSIW